MKYDFGKICGVAATIAMCIVLFAERDLHGKALPEFYRGVRASAMGNAFTALSDDADAVFYNPAGLALNENFQFRLANPKFDISTDDLAAYKELRGALSQVNATTLQPLFGKNLYASASVYPSIYFPFFELGYYYGFQTHLVTNNQAMPVIDTTYLVDRGIVGGFGFETRGLSKRHYFRLGTTMKWIERTGIDRSLRLAEVVVANKEYLTSLLGGPAYGVGIGLGFQYEISVFRNDDMILGAAWQDIGDTQFGSASEARRPPSIRSNLAAGVAWDHLFAKTRLGDIKWRVAFEGRHLSELNIDPRLQLHAGTELKLGDLALQGGWCQDGFTGGATLDLGFIEVGAVTYNVENQPVAFGDRERRYMAQVTFKLDVMGRKRLNRQDQERRKRPRTY